MTILQTIEIFEKYGIRDSLGMKLFLIVSHTEGLTILEILDNLRIKKIGRREYDSNTKHLLKLAHGVSDRYKGLKLIRATRSKNHSLSGPAPYVFSLTAKGKKLYRLISH